MDALFIPTLSFWENGNSWYGSLGSLRFFIQPQEQQLSVTTWRGQLTLERSSREEETSFPLDQDGLGKMRDWLASQAD